MGIVTNLNCTDEKGNQLISGMIDKDRASVGLKLVSEARVRDLGKIIRKSNGTFVYRKFVDEKNIFRKTNSWGINSKIVEELPEDAKVEFKSKAKTYKITVKDIKEHGSYLYFKNEGFEKQIFVPLNYWQS